VIVARTRREGTVVMAYLDREAILAADDAETKDIPIPEWGGVVKIRSISGRARDQFEASLREGKGKNADVNLRNLRARLIVMCAVNEDGTKMFAQEGDVNRLGAKNAKPLDRLFDACKDMIGMSEEDVETYTEDFGQSPDEDSSTD
jgi:hypothetical protein